MADHKLVLFPVNARYAPRSEERLQSDLSGCGFLGTPVRIFGDTHFAQGARFTTLVPLLRPHTAIVLGAEMREEARVDSSTLCTIAFDGPTSEIRFLGGANADGASCGNCRGPVEDWPDVVSAWYSAPDSHSWSCPACGAAQQPPQFHWAGTNGFGRFAIDLWHIHPGQAAPSPELLNLLASLTGTAWDYFYYRL